MAELKCFNKEILEEKVFNENMGAYLQYALIATQDMMPPEKNLETVYSILIVKTAATHDSESFFIYDVARTPERARYIFDIMRDNSVTPCTAAEVLEDLL